MAISLLSLSVSTLVVPVSHHHVVHVIVALAGPQISAEASFNRIARYVKFLAGVDYWFVQIVSMPPLDRHPDRTAHLCTSLSAPSSETDYRLSMAFITKAHGPFL